MSQFAHYIWNIKTKMIFYDQIFNSYVASCDISYDTNITLFSQLFLTKESTPNKKKI